MFCIEENGLFSADFWWLAYEDVAYEQVTVLATRHRYVTVNTGLLARGIPGTYNPGKYTKSIGFALHAHWDVY